MIKPQNPEPGMWKENTRRDPAWRIKPTSSLLIEKYLRQQRQHGMHRQGGSIKRRVSPRRLHAKVGYGYVNRQPGYDEPTGVRSLGNLRQQRAGHSARGGSYLRKFAWPQSDAIVLCSREAVRRRHHSGQVGPMQGVIRVACGRPVDHWDQRKGGQYHGSRGGQ
jgi:hypothetical protein